MHAAGLADLDEPMLREGLLEPAGAASVARRFEAHAYLDRRDVLAEGTLRARRS